jgi:translation initiation factor IF-2
MGHIDHGKSTLLDYIRKTKVTETEAGGITQHLSAYEVEHTDSSGEKRLITFLDTPGHEAFQHLRSRGSSVADIAILIVAADDGVKPQTLEALKAIEESNIPFLVAISKIDKTNADVEKTKMSLVENGVYLEGMGGSVSYTLIDSKSGKGIPELLDLLLLATDMEELDGDPSLPATGTVIESHCDPKRGVSATLIIKDGSLKTGEYVVAGTAYAPLRIVENFLGKKIKEATFSSPIMVVGFSENPPVGSVFTTVSNKKEAIELAKKNANNTSFKKTQYTIDEDDPRFCLPVIIKSDVVGSIDAIKHELKKFDDERTSIQIIHEGVGSIVEGDVKYASGDKNTIIIGFNVNEDTPAKEMAERMNIEIAKFSIIYELTDWIESAIEKRRPKVDVEKELGRAKILKTFSYSKKTQTLGCRVEFGELAVKDEIKILRGEEELGRGKIISIKSGMSETNKATEGNEYGIQTEVSMETEPKYDDVLVSFTVTKE